VALALAVATVMLVAGSPSVASEPGPGSGARPWSPDAVELARTAKEAVVNGSTDESCTGWRSTYLPPPTIRVLRTRGPAVGTVQEVDFRSYVEDVLRAEWTDWYPIEAQKTGAIAVKQYAWYYTIVYRGQTTESGECYDVRDDTIDQYYSPEDRTPSARNLRGVAATWDVTLRKRQGNGSRFFLTGYRSGSVAGCGDEADHWRLYQRGVLSCANAGLRWPSIMRTYLDPRLEIVEPGGHDIVGDQDGDVSMLVTAEGLSRPHIYERGTLGAYVLAPDQGLTHGTAQLREARAVDMTMDGRDDLITFHEPAEGGWRVDVSSADGTRYGPPITWASGMETLSPDGTLMAADMDGDGKGDVAMLLAGLEAGTATLRVHRGTGSGLKPPVDRWTGPLELAESRAWLSDATGDGRADLLVAQDLADYGIGYRVAPSAPNGGGLGGLMLWLAEPGLSWATTSHAVGDVDRDGRDDLWTVSPTVDGVAVDVLMATKTSTFVRQPRWASGPGDPTAMEDVKLASTDVDYDGRTDLLLLLDRVQGTRFITLRPRASGLVVSAPFDEPTLDWDSATPY